MHCHLPLLCFLPLLLAVGCAPKVAPPTAPGQPSDLLRTAPASTLAGQAVAALTKRHETGVRTGLRITPPGHHFMTFLVAGEIGDEALEPLLDQLATSCSAHVTAAGGTITQPCSADLRGLPAGLDRAILSREPAPDSGLRGRHGAYRVGEHTGWITVLAMRDPDAPGSWRIGGALHEAP